MSYTSPPVQASGDLITAATWNSNFSYLYDSGWIAFSVPGYTNSWVNNGGPASGATAAGYRKIGNVVRLGGTIKTGSFGNAFVTLPGGFRPNVQASIACVTTTNAIDAVQLTVTNLGVCTCIHVSGTGTIPSLDGATFTID